MRRKGIRPNTKEPTKVRLAGVLMDAGLGDLAKEALQGRFDDYESESATPICDLVTHLRGAGREDLARRAMDGEWDGTAEEGEAWMEREGRALVSGIDDEPSRR